MAKFVSFRVLRGEINRAINVDLVAYVESVPMQTGCNIVFSTGTKLGLDESFQDVMEKLAGRGPGGIW